MKESYTLEQKKLFVSLAESTIAFQNGNKEVFTTIYECCMPHVLAIIHSMQVPEVDSEDVALNAMMAVYQGLDSVKEPITTYRWVMSIARNKSIDYFRAAGKRVILEESICRDENELGEDEYLYQNAKDVCGNEFTVMIPEEMILNKEKQRILYEIVMQLKESQRQIILMHCVEERSFKEIAEITNSSENTVKSLFYRGLNKLENLILDTEKRDGVKLHSIGLVPFLVGYSAWYAQTQAYSASAVQVACELVKNQLIVWENTKGAVAAKGTLADAVIANTDEKAVVGTVIPSSKVAIVKIKVAAACAATIGVVGIVAAVNVKGNNGDEVGASYENGNEIVSSIEMNSVSEVALESFCEPSIEHFSESVDEIGIDTFFANQTAEAIMGGIAEDGERGVLVYLQYKKKESFPSKEVVEEAQIGDIITTCSGNQYRVVEKGKMDWANRYSILISGVNDDWMYSATFEKDRFYVLDADSGGYIYEPLGNENSFVVKVSENAKAYLYTDNHMDPMLEVNLIELLRDPVNTLNGEQMWVPLDYPAKVQFDEKGELIKYTMKWYS